MLIFEIKTDFMKHFLFLFLLITQFMQAQDLKSYQFYSKEKEPLTFAEIVNELADYDVVLFGEMHNNSINHWLQLKLTQALYKEKEKHLVLGAEMMERDNQKELNLYIEDSIDVNQLSTKARLWPNFATDYKPLVDFAKTHDLKFVATNIPRRYASVVAKNGIDSLESYSKIEKKYMAKLPIKVDTLTPGYDEMLEMMKEHPHGDPMDFVSAQAIKDATMAESILKNRKRKQLFLHFNGDFHSKEYGGIYWYLKKKRKRLKVAVISVFETAEEALPFPSDVKPTEFNLILPEDMTKTY